MPQLSIIVPIYKGEQYIVDLVNSICSQDLSDFELILIDDGSPDNSGIICDELAVKDSRIVVVHKSNGGQSSARNTGLKIASGEYIAFADDDDIVHPMMYSSLIAVMKELHLTYAAANFRNVQQDKIKEIVFDTSIPECRIIDEKEYIHCYFTPNWKIPIWNKVYHKSLLKGIQFQNHHLGEDNLFSYEMIKRAHQIAFIDIPMYFQRMHGNNYEYIATEHLVELLKVKESILNDIKRNYPKEYQNARKLFIYECIRIFKMYAGDDKVKWENQLQQIRILIKRNIKGFMFGDFPRGHKLQLIKYVLSDFKKIENMRC